MKMTLAGWMKITLAAVVVTWVIGAGAAMASVPLANLTEKWDTPPDGWQSLTSGETTWTINGTAIGITFPAVNSLTPAVGTLSTLFASTNAGLGRFTGDYAANGIIEASFDALGDQLSGGVWLYFVANNHTWKYQLTLSSGNTAWQTVTVPFAYSSGWKTYDVTPSAEVMKSDLANIVEIGIEGYKKGAAAESLIVDNFKLVGPWNGDCSDGLIADSWRTENGITGAATDDQDGDGFNNYAEFLAGTDAKDAKSFFQVEIGKNSDGKTVVSWKHELGRTFHLIETTALVGQEAVQETVKTKVSEAPKNTVTVTDDTATGVHFYKVGIQK